MRIHSIAIIAALPLLVAAALAHASDPLVGKWKTMDDETGKPMSITEVYLATDGTLAAKVVETLNKPNALCSECSGKQKDQPVTGMMVFWDVAKDDEGWGDGKGFKPSTGDSFKVKSVKLVDNDTLEITGCKLFFCRSANWKRVE